MLIPRQEYETALAEVRRLGRGLPEADRRYRHMTRPRDVLYTVPHGAPGNDAIAPEVGFAAFEQTLARGVDADIILSVCCRYGITDMNRPWSRNTNFRREVRRRIVEDKPRLVIDVHSFPDVYPGFQGRDVVLLHTKNETDKEFLRHYATLLKLASIELGQPAVIDVQDQTKPIIHDIVRESRELGIPANSTMLVEHNESGCAPLYGAMHARAVRALLAERKVPTVAS